MLKSKYTKNKELVRIIRNYEIELQRPKGLKLLDKILNQVPINCGDVAIFVSDNIHKECLYISSYKGKKVVKCALPKSQVKLIRLIYVSSNNSRKQKRKFAKDKRKSLFLFAG